MDSVENAIENPIFGRKVFCLNPIYSTREVIIPHLREQEFEVCVIEHYMDAKNVLKQFPDSICFIDIDGQLEHEHWFSFIHSCQELCPTVLFGILTSHTNAKERFLLARTVSLPLGFILMEESLDGIHSIIKDLLVRFGAKGRRQYVRASCTASSNASILIRTNNVAVELPLIDISLAGAACILAEEYAKFFQIHLLFDDVTIRLHQKEIQCDAVVYALAPYKNYCKVVLLFKGIISHSAKSAIHSYVAEVLQGQVNKIILSNPKDLEDYTKKKKHDSEKNPT
ncbi:MAG: hypothetical protein IJR49_05250 [Treponema sp.]|nr:hypothetical protein [Treponema sp.]